MSQNADPEHPESRARSTQKSPEGDPRPDEPAACRPREKILAPIAVELDEHEGDLPPEGLL